MSKPASEQRGFARFNNLDDQYVGKFELNGEPFEARVIDVSRNGIGILTEKELSPNSAIVLYVGDKSIELEVVYSQKDLIYPEFHRCGLKRGKHSNQNLLSLWA